jgi:hypothetical protein
MNMLSDADLLAKVEAFLKEHDMAPTRFGREIMGEASLVTRLREGRSLSLRNANKLLEFMASYQPAPARANAA